MRVIAGSAGGVPLKAPRDGTRPTTDRVREAVFSALADWAGAGGAPAATQLTGLALLDLYAGSGAVAIEALSRGARRAVAVDSATGAVKTMQANATAAGLPLDVVRATVDAYLTRFGKDAADRFDIVWLDPPYDLAEDELSAVFTRLVDGSLLVPGGLVVLERSARGPGPVWPARLDSAWCKRYGETVIHFAEAADQQEEP